MNCWNCGYWVREKGKSRPSCHYYGSDEDAPCAQEDWDDWVDEPEDYIVNECPSMANTYPDDC